MNKLLTALFIATLGLGMNQPVLAHDDDTGNHCQRHDKKSFEQADTDHDGTLDPEEAKSLNNRNFDELDTDHDGTLSSQEVNACARHKCCRHQHGKKSTKHDKHSKMSPPVDAEHGK